MPYRISELAAEIDIQLETYEIRNEKPFDSFARVTSNVQSDSCVYISEKKYAKNVIRQNKITMVITTNDVASALESSEVGVCITKNPKVLYSKFLDYVNRKHDEEICKKTIIGAGCCISKNAHIYDNNVEIGNNVVIEDFAVIHPHTKIGDGCLIRTNAIIGGQDYNYYYEERVPIHIYHAGSVEIGRNVEIGCNTGVGRALYIGSKTIIGDDSKISANCGVGHDSQIGNRVMIYSGSILGGNVIVEDDAHITLNCTIKNGLRIGQESIVGMGSNVLTNVKAGTKVFGNPARRMDF